MLDIETVRASCPKREEHGTIKYRRDGESKVVVAKKIWPEPKEKDT